MLINFLKRYFKKLAYLYYNKCFLFLTEPLTIINNDFGKRLVGYWIKFVYIVHNGIIL